MEEMLTPSPTNQATCPRPARRSPGARKLTMRVMLGLLGASVLLGFAGKGKAHMLTGLAFSALLADHVWQRRKAL